MQPAPILPRSRPALRPDSNRYTCGIRPRPTHPRLPLRLFSSASQLRSLPYVSSVTTSRTSCCCPHTHRFPAAGAGRVQPRMQPTAHPTPRTSRAPCSTTDRRSGPTLSTSSSSTSYPATCACPPSCGWLSVRAFRLPSRPAGVGPSAFPSQSCQIARLRPRNSQYLRLHVRVADDRVPNRPVAFQVREQVGRFIIRHPRVLRLPGISPVEIPGPD